MTYSFTKATTKHVLKPATKIWGFYFILAFGILIVFKVQLLLQVRESKRNTESSKGRARKNSAINKESRARKREIIL